MERGSGGTAYMDAEALAVWCGVSERTVRRRCSPAYSNGRAMYEAAIAREVLLSSKRDAGHTPNP